MLLGAFLMLMLVSAAFEIVMVARKRHLTAAWTYAASDVARTVLLVVPAFVHGGLRAVLWGGVAFGAVRVMAMLHWLRREFGADLRPNRTLWRFQLAYALPFALAVGIEVLQANLHSYVVASRFDAATFAIYAVGCLQIPLVDLITTSAANVMMVKMAEDGFTRIDATALALWHDTMSRLALLIFPLAVFLLLLARDVIITLFTGHVSRERADLHGVDADDLPAVLCVDAVLRAYAQTRFLFAMNVIRLGLVVGLIGWFLVDVRPGRRRARHAAGDDRGAHDQHRANRAAAEGAVDENSAVGPARGYRRSARSPPAAPASGEPYVVVAAPVVLVAAGALYWAVYAAIAYARVPLEAPRADRACSGKTRGGRPVRRRSPDPASWRDPP